MTEKLTLESPVVQETKRRFLRSRLARQYNVSFDLWFRGVERNQTCKSLGRAYGFSAKRSAYITRYFFEPLFKRDGRDRIRARTKEKWSYVTDTLDTQLRPTAAIRIVAKRAEDAGCDVLFLSEKTRGRPQTQRSTLKIGRKTVKIHDVMQEKKHRLIIGRGAARFDHVVLVRRPQYGPPNQMFVCPSYLLRLEFKKRKVRAITLHLNAPMQGKCPRGGLCLFGFADAWWYFRRPARM